MAVRHRQPERRKTRYAFHVHIGILFSVLILLSGWSVSQYNAAQNRKIILSSSEAVFQRIVQALRADTHKAMEDLREAVETFAHHSLSSAATVEERLGALKTVVNFLVGNPLYTALYVGYDNGDFHLVRPLTSPRVRELFAPPEGAVWMVTSVTARASGERLEEHLFFDKDLTLMSRTKPAPTRYDPRERPWYTGAGADKLGRTAPYVFHATGEVGLSFSQRSEGGASVVGADVTLTNLSEMFSKYLPTPSSKLVSFLADETVVAYDTPAEILRFESSGAPRLAKVGELHVPVLDAALEKFRRGEIVNDHNMTVQGRQWKVGMHAFSVYGGKKRYMIIASPMDELLADADAIRDKAVAVTLVIVLMTIPVGWLISRMVSKPLRLLAAEAERIRSFCFDETPPVDSIILEIDKLARAMSLMKSALRKFLDITQALSAESRFDRLLRLVLDETVAAARADGGAIYLVSDDGGSLVSGLARWPDAAEPETALDPLALGGPSGPSGPLGHYNPLAAAAARGTTQTVVVDAASRFDDKGLLDPVFASGEFRQASVVAVPLRNRAAELVGVLCLVKAVSDGGAAAIAPDLLSFIEAISGASAVSIDNQRLILDLREMLASFIELVAGAIDAKSPYTGGHCQRVPPLTRMLAEAACEATTGPFAGFTLNEDQWEELHTACWLHDCGKVTTPEYVVDKATKLETIHDRIHEVRTRFEVIKRDAWIDFWRGAAEGGDREMLAAERDGLLAALDEEFAFVAKANLGAEFLAPDNVERLTRIASRTYERTLDNRLGVSRHELDRMGPAPAGGLPVVERLLADKPEHVIARPDRDKLDPGNPYGFRMEAPEALYNRGELYNLRVDRGTLTAEERYKINEHIVETIRMLGQLHFPKQIMNVPEIAGGHHETMDGRGYPRRVPARDLSPQARMLAIADIFEALTAADRPYKPAKTLSESIAIMSQMSRGGHIDPELFELFLTAGVYRRYAALYLQASQIDEVDVAAVLARGIEPPGPRTS